MLNFGKKKDDSGDSDFRDLGISNRIKIYSRNERAATSRFSFRLCNTNLREAANYPPPANVPNCYPDIFIRSFSPRCNGARSATRRLIGKAHFVETLCFRIKLLSWYRQNPSNIFLIAPLANNFR